MKRVISFILAFLTVCSCFALVISADTTSDTAISNTSKKISQLPNGAVSYTCSYSEDGKSVEIHGNVNYDTQVSYGKSTIEIYKLKEGQSFSDIVNAEEQVAVASVNIYVKFDVTLEIKELTDKFCKYAVALRTPDGKLILAAAPKRPLVESKYHIDEEKSGFKGISTANNDNLSVFGDMGFGTAIVPVYFDKLVSSSSGGYIFSHESGNYYFDKAYVDSLDSKIRTYSANGARVYLQLLLPYGLSELAEDGQKNLSTVKYQMPDVYNGDVVFKLNAYISFLTTRYSEYCDGKVGGMIIGKKIDTFENNYCSLTDIRQYAEKYSYYVTVVANTARFINADMDIVVPFGNFNSYSKKITDVDNAIPPSELLQAVTESLDNSFISDFKYSTMIESDMTPIKFETSGEEHYYFPADSLRIGINSISEYTVFVDKLQKNYQCAPQGILYLWQITDDVLGNELALAYAYGYYKLYNSPEISAFAVSFDNLLSDAIENTKKLIQQIDTASGATETQSLLELINVSSWSELIGEFDISTTVLRDVYASNDSGYPTTEWRGCFSYFDFSSGDTGYWRGASNTVILKTDREENEKRALRHVISKPVGAAHSDLLCMYEYNENFIYTPALKFDLKIDDGEENKGGVYEIIVTVGTRGSLVEKKYTVVSGENYELWLDLSEFNVNNSASYIKISTRSITGKAREYSLWLYGISGFSAEHDNETLAALIEAERLKIRGLLSDEDQSNIDNTIYWILFAIVLIVVLGASVAFIILRRDDSDKRAKRLKKKSEKK